MKLRDLGWLFKRALAGWWNDNVPRLGASLAYYTLFALAPILIVAISIAGLVFGAETVQRQVTTEITGLVGEQGGKAVRASAGSYGSDTNSTTGWRSASKKRGPRASSV